MKLTEIGPTKINWDTLDDPHNHAHLSHSAHSMCEATGVHQCVSMPQVRSLNEATYKELASMIDGNFLSQKIRADALNGIQLQGFDDDTARFFINSSEYTSNRIRYQCSVKFDQWDDVLQDSDFNNNERARMLLWVGNIRLHCTCPSFLFHGYAFLLNTLDASIYPEVRNPTKTNPDERGIVCKHLNRILRVLPFYSGQIAAELKRQGGGKP